jgi:hypothetical protein
MKLLPASLAVFLALSLVAVSASGDPLSWVELRADSIAFHFPGHGLIEITAWYSVINNMDHDEVVVSDIAFSLDGEVIDIQPIDVTRSLNECRLFETPTECKGDCYVSPMPPIQLGMCQWFYRQPMDTIPEGCFCFYSAQIVSTLPYSGQQTASFCLDPGNALWEPSEGNNRRSMFVGPVAAEQTSWGGVKVLY